MSGKLNLTALQDLQKLIRDTETLETVIDKFKAHTSQQSVDKYSMGFNQDDRFNVFSLKANLTCYSGYYGSSSCSTYISVSSKDEIQRAFTRYLNKNLDAVINGIVAELKAESGRRIDEAESAISAFQELVDQIKDQDIEP